MCAHVAGQIRPGRGDVVENRGLDRGNVDDHGVREIRQRLDHEFGDHVRRRGHDHQRGIGQCLTRRVNGAHGLAGADVLGHGLRGGGGVAHVDAHAQVLQSQPDARTQKPRTDHQDRSGCGSNCWDHRHIPTDASRVPTSVWDSLRTTPWR